MEKNYWQIDDNLYKVYISADVYNELEQDFKIDVDMLESVKTDKTKLLIWCSPSNPTGVVYSKEEADAIY